MPGGPTRAVTLARRILSTPVQVRSAVTAALVPARPQRLVHELAGDTDIVYQGTVQQGLTAGPAQARSVLCGLRRDDVCENGVAVGETCGKLASGSEGAQMAKHSP